MGAKRAAAAVSWRCRSREQKVLEVMKLGLRERGHGAEVLVDVEHGGIQQGVDVLQALQPGLKAPAALRLQLPQLLLRQLGEGGRRRRHRRH